MSPPSSDLQVSDHIALSCSVGNPMPMATMPLKLMSAADLSKLADLPSFDALRSMLLGMLTMQGAAFVRVLDAKVKKEQPAAAPAV